ncbi:uncharacterized protein METZ01_LOCUS482473 [marine metagenome]|uniref:Uncharacterized protein n=1 Tax=marine metagenome TaxID=408172 RepID=A0A383CC38_9ZZZZ
MSLFFVDYMVFVCCSTIGAIQIAAYIGNLRALLILRQRIASLVFGASILIGSAFWFFLSEERNINDTAGGLDANSQAVGFFLGALIGTILTLIISSVINFDLKFITNKDVDGLDALREQNYFLAIKDEYSRFRRNWRTYLAKQVTDLPKNIIYQLVTTIIVKLR